MGVLEVQGRLCAGVQRALCAIRDEHLQLRARQVESAIERGEIDGVDAVDLDEGDGLALSIEPLPVQRQHIVGAHQLIRAVARLCGLDPRGLPLAVQLVSPPGGEGQLLALAAQLEELRPWPRTAQGYAA